MGLECDSNIAINSSESKQMMQEFEIKSNGTNKKSSQKSKACGKLEKIKQNSSSSSSKPKRKRKKSKKKMENQFNYCVRCDERLLKCYFTGADWVRERERESKDVFVHEFMQKFKT